MLESCSLASEAKGKCPFFLSSSFYIDFWKKGAKMSSFQTLFSGRCSPMALWKTPLDDTDRIYQIYRWMGKVVSRWRSAFGHQITSAAPITGLRTDIKSAWTSYSLALSHFLRFQLSFPLVLGFLILKPLTRDQSWLTRAPNCHPCSRIRSCGSSGELKPTISVDWVLDQVSPETEGQILCSKVSSDKF